MAIWSLENMGLGNLARRRRGRAELRAAAAEQAQAVDQVRREVAEAHALAGARRQEAAVARLRVETAGRAFQADLLRARNLEGRPIEVLNSGNLLAAARQDLIRALVGYSQAQVPTVRSARPTTRHGLARRQGLCRRQSMKFTFRTTLLTILLVFLLGTVLSLGLSGYLTAQATAHDLTTKVLGQSSLAIDRQIEGLLRIADHQGEFAHKLFRAGVLGAHDPAALVRHTQTVLEPSRS